MWKTWVNAVIRDTSGISSPRGELMKDLVETFPPTAERIEKTRRRREAFFRHAQPTAAAWRWQASGQSSCEPHRKVSALQTGVVRVTLSLPGVCAGECAVCSGAVRADTTLNSAFLYRRFCAWNRERNPASSVSKQLLWLITRQPASLRLNLKLLAANRISSFPPMNRNKPANTSCLNVNVTVAEAAKMHQDIMHEFH